MHELADKLRPTEVPGAGQGDSREFGFQGPEWALARDDPGDLGDDGGWQALVDLVEFLTGVVGELKHGLMTACGGAEP